VTKPFHPMELMARVKSQLRRYVQLGTYDGQKTIEIDGLLLDEFSVKINTRKTPMESKATEKMEAAFLDSLDQEWNDLPGLDLRNVSFPIHLKEHDTFSVHSKFPTNSTKVLNVNISISGTTESGKDFTTTAGIITQPYLEQLDVNELIKAKTKGDTDE